VALRTLVPWCCLIFLLLSVAAGCASTRQDDGYVLLARYKEEWKRTAPGHLLQAPVFHPTPSVGSSGAAGGAARGVVVFLDPGHGGVDTGTIGTTIDGQTVAEKTITLAIAQKTAAYLEQEGYVPVLSRTDDSLPGAEPSDYTSDGKALTPDGVLADLQRRIDRANASHARVLLSIHLNGFSDPSVGGSETFYDSARSFGDENRRFATLIQESLISAFRANGYDTPDRGVTDDVDLQTESLGALDGTYRHLVILGPAVPGRLRPSEMPGALSEPLFLSNPAEASAAVDPAVQDLIASAYARAIDQFLSNRS
jgi:N-acetylmuramoyl-L-alanine amidase